MRITLDVKYAPISIEMRIVMISGGIEKLTRKHRGHKTKQNKQRLRGRGGCCLFCAERGLRFV